MFVASKLPQHDAEAVLRYSRHCRAKYYGAHLGAWDVAEVPWLDEPLKCGR